MGGGDRVYKSKTGLPFIKENKLVDKSTQD